MQKSYNTINQTTNQRIVSLITDNTIQYYFNSVFERLGIKNSLLKFKYKQ
jgi:hypothetical protein